MDDRLAQDALLNLLLPILPLAIGLAVLAAVVVVAFRRVQQGPSRISTALLVTGAAVLAICAVGFLLSD